MDARIFMGVKPPITEPINWHSGEQKLDSPNDLYHVRFHLRERRTVVIFTKAAPHFNAGAYLWDQNKNFRDANEDSLRVMVSHNGYTIDVHPWEAYMEMTLEKGTYYTTLVPLVDGEFADGMSFTQMGELISHRNAKPPRNWEGRPGDGTGIFSFHILCVDSASSYIPMLE